jgi:hypothetical protein
MIPFFGSKNKESDHYSCEDGKELAFLMSCLKEEDARLEDDVFLRCATRIYETTNSSLQRKKNIDAAEEANEMGRFLYSEFCDVLRTNTEKKLRNFMKS